MPGFLRLGFADGACGACACGICLTGPSGWVAGSVVWTTCGSGLDFALDSFADPLI